MSIDLEALKQQVAHGYIDIHGGDGSDEEAAILALIEAVEAAQAVVVETLMCPAGHLDALEVALSKFEESS